MELINIDNNIINKSSQIFLMNSSFSKKIVVCYFEYCECHDPQIQL